MDDLFLEFNVQEDKKVTSNPIISEMYNSLLLFCHITLLTICKLYIRRPNNVEKRALETDEDVSFSNKKSKMESILDDIK